MHYGPMKPEPRAIALAFFVLGAAGARAGGLSIEHVWAQPTPPRAIVGRVYLAIANNGAEVDHLVAASTDVAGAAEVSGVRILQDVPNQRHLVNVDIAPGGKILFSPGGYHILLRNLKHPLVAGERFRVVLTFEKAGDIPLDVEVEAPKPAAPP
ncbi:copper chaperone PCu(A)C [Rhodoblastus sp.]|uniref:copper chaperone PCu(A)C n=1 Tax=Rhodoblastus sp. TaxID=1962975 RepID=UPI002605429D|nr:copper chaperone PCu(A)C [Rhodoblastus sp.]